MAYGVARRRKIRISVGKGICICIRSVIKLPNAIKSIQKMLGYVSKSRIIITWKGIYKLVPHKLSEVFDPGMVALCDNPEYIQYSLLYASGTDWIKIHTHNCHILTSVYHDKYYIV